jgi:hypothetical protein
LQGSLLEYNNFPMEPIHEILPGLIGTKPASVKKSRKKPPLGYGSGNLFPPLDILRAAWEHIVGPTLAARTRPISIIGGRLVVESPSVEWRRELVRYEGALLDRVRRLLGNDAITGLDWKTNPALATGTILEKKPPQRELDSSVREAAQTIQNPELRERFLRQIAARGPSA